MNCSRVTQPEDEIGSSCPECGHSTNQHPFWKESRRYDPGVTGCLVCAPIVEVGEIHLIKEGNVVVPAYLEGGPGRVKLIAMSDGVVRWKK